MCDTTAMTNNDELWTHTEGSPYSWTHTEGSPHSLEAHSKEWTNSNRLTFVLPRVLRYWCAAWGPQVPCYSRAAWGSRVQRYSRATWGPQVLHYSRAAWGLPASWWAQPLCCPRRYPAWCGCARPARPRQPRGSHARAARSSREPETRDNREINSQKNCNVRLAGKLETDIKQVIKWYKLIRKLGTQSIKNTRILLC